MSAVPRPSDGSSRDAAEVTRGLLAPQPSTSDLNNRSGTVSPRVGEEGPVPIEWDTVRRPASSILDAVGRTPLVRLNRVVPDGLEVFTKVEWFGPTGSVKDRIYVEMLGNAEARGALKPGMTIIECSTGNAGIACAAAAAV
jgi:hypothetical protein